VSGKNAILVGLIVRIVVNEIELVAPGDQSPQTFGTSFLVELFFL
jgi:hypothetical protein